MTTDSLNKKMHCPNCGLPMSYQEFEDEDGENFQWVCDGPNYDTKRKGCWGRVALEGPLEFAEISNEQLVDTLINEVELLVEKGPVIPEVPFEHPDPPYMGSRGYEIDKWKFEILRRMK